jgi:hypothetical protein
MSASPRIRIWSIVKPVGWLDAFENAAGIDADPPRNVGEFPVEQSTRLKLVLNPKTAEETWPRDSADAYR